MIKRLILKLYYFLIKIRIWFRNNLNFWIPNFFFLLRGRIKILGNNLIIHQYTKITGLGTVTIGDNCVFGYKLGGRHRKGYIEIQPRYKNAVISIASKVATNNNLFICSANRVEIGANTRIGENVTIIDYDAHSIDPSKRYELGVLGEVIIGENVWIGNNVVILKNCVIGNNSIIAAGSVVTRSFEKNLIIGGNPAKIIKTIP